MTGLMAKREEFWEEPRRRSSSSEEEESEEEREEPTETERKGILMGERFMGSLTSFTVPLTSSGEKVKGFSTIRPPSGPPLCPSKQGVERGESGASVSSRGCPSVNGTDAGHVAIDGAYTR